MNLQTQLVPVAMVHVSTMQHPMDRVRGLVNRRTPARLRAEAMGFVFSMPFVSDFPDIGGYLVSGNFRCVCGRVEFYRYSVSSELARYGSKTLLESECDIAAQLERFGSFSIDHLIDDGYTPLEIGEMMWKADNVETTHAPVP